MGRAHVRAYALAVGLDPDDVLKRLADLLPAEIDPVQALRARARQRFADDHPVAAALGAGAAAWGRHTIALVRTAAMAGSRAVALRRRRRGRRPHPRSVCRRVADRVLAWITGTHVSGVWRAARWPFLVHTVLTVALYGVVSQQLGRRTPGAAIVDRLGRAIQQRGFGSRLARWHV